MKIFQVLRLGPVEEVEEQKKRTGEKSDCENRYSAGMYIKDIWKEDIYVFFLPLTRNRESTTIAADKTGLNSLFKRRTPYLFLPFSSITVYNSFDISLRKGGRAAPATLKTSTT